MHQVEEIPPPPSAINFNGTLLKTEMIEQPTCIPTSISIPESTVAPTTQIHPVPIAPAQTLITSTPTIKKVKRGFRTYLNNKKLNRPSTKPATLLARPSTNNISTILPNTQKPVLIANSIAPIIPKTVSTLQTAPPPGFTTYLVFDGNQGQLVQVANEGPKPVTFRNQSGQILQATPITVVAPTNQPVVSSFPVNGDCSLLSNSSQTITTVRTSSSIDMQQQTTLTSDTTTLTTQQLTGIIHQPSIVPTTTTTILNGNTLQTYDDNNSSLDESKISNNHLSLSLSQIAQKVNHRHRRSSSSSTSKKKRGRPRLYERDPFTNKPIKSDSILPTNELTVPNTTLVMPGQTTTTNFNPLPQNSCGSFIFSNQPTQISVPNPSLLQQHQYSYPSLLNGTTLTPSTYTTYSNNSNPTFSYSSQSITPAQNTQISSVTNSNSIPLNSSPRKTSNNDDVTIHYIGGYVIRESNRPFSSLNENHNQKENNEQIRCIICQKLDFSQKFFDQEKKFCSNICSFKSNENKIPPTIINEPIRVTPIIPQQSIVSNIDDQIQLPPDHGLPNDPNKWTVSQVGDFIARLTNETIREAFYESEMDGQALLLMTQEHLRETMKIKLGPSLIISSEIEKLRERAKTFCS